MKLKRILKNNLIQISSLTEKSLKLQWRFKLTTIVSFFTPLISIFLPLIILGQFLTLSVDFGPWTTENYFIYQFMAYQIMLLKRLIVGFPEEIRQEKFWKTLQGLIIAPFNRFNLLLGTFFAHVILILIPISIFFVLSYIAVPISFLTLICVILFLILVALIFSGIGLIIGIFAISRENYWRLLLFLMNIFIWLSCLTYPFEIFPGFIQNIINLNPLYYIFDIIRLLWIENNVFLTFSTHPFNVLVIFLAVVILPCVGVYFFNLIYKKYGIEGY